MSELTKRARDLIATVDDGDGPSDAERGRLRANLLARVGASAAMGSAAVSATAKAAAGVAAISGGAIAAEAASTVTGAGVASGFLTAVATKALAVLAIVALGATGYTLLGAPAGPSKPVAWTASTALSAPLRAPVPKRAPPQVLPQATAASEAPPVARAAVLAAPAPPASLLPAGNPSRPPRADETFAEETAALAASLAALRNGRPEDALSVLDVEDARDAPGTLGEERTATRIDALCMLGRRAEARSSAEHFLADHPHSVLAPRVRASCGLGSSR